MSDGTSARGLSQDLLSSYSKELDALRELNKRGALIVSAQPEAAELMFQRALQLTAVWKRTWQPVFGWDAAPPSVARRFAADAAQIEALTLKGLAMAEVPLGKRSSAMKRLKRALFLLDGREDRVFERLRGLVRLQQGFVMAEIDAGAAAKIFRRAHVELTATEQWEAATVALTGEAHALLRWDDRTTFLSAMESALRFAEEHEQNGIQKLIQQELASWQIDWDPTGEILGTVASSRERRGHTPDEIGYEFSTAEYLRARGDHVAADLRMRRAAKLLDGNWERQFGFLRMWANQLLVSNRMQDGFEIATEAFRLAEEHGRLDLAWAAWAEFLPVLAESDDPTVVDILERSMDGMRGMIAKDDFAKALLRRGAVYARRGQLTKALGDYEEVKRTAPSSDLRMAAHLGCSEVREAMDQLPQALEDNLAAIRILTEVAPDRPQPGIELWKDSLHNAVGAYTNAAHLAVRLGRHREGFSLAEQGKAFRLRAVLAGNRGSRPPNTGDLEWLDFDAIRNMLGADAALVIFAVKVHTTVVLIVKPDQSAPDGAIVPLGALDFEALLPTVPMGSSDPWPQPHLQTLSEQFLPHLRDVADQYATVYLVPDGRLYFAPFAAFVFEDGSRLIEHCALASVPSATVLASCRSRSEPDRAHTCLAIGVGEVPDESGKPIRFSEQARTIVDGHAWAAPPGFLLNEDATVAAFFAESSTASVVHLSCHGIMDETNPRSLSASQLQLADGRVSALDISDKGGWLEAELIFLNACASGSFYSPVGSEAGGFWEAFLTAGAASLIATLAYVEPRAAERLAAGFYRHWLHEHCTKAEALRQSQLDLLRSGAPLHAWAAHILVGDHR